MLRNSNTVSASSKLYKTRTAIVVIAALLHQQWHWRDTKYCNVCVCVCAGVFVCSVNVKARSSLGRAPELTHCGGWRTGPITAAPCECTEPPWPRPPAGSTSPRRPVRVSIKMSCCVGQGHFSSDAEWANSTWARFMLSYVISSRKGSIKLLLFFSILLRNIFPEDLFLFVLQESVIQYIHLSDQWHAIKSITLKYDMMQISLQESDSIACLLN